jgi:hypothetical protein
MSKSVAFIVGYLVGSATGGGVALLLFAIWLWRLRALGVI